MTKVKVTGEFEMGSELVVGECVCSLVNRVY